MNDTNNQNDNQEIKNEREAAEEHLWRHYSPEEMLDVWCFRINETLKIKNQILQTIADGVNKKNKE